MGNLKKLYEKFFITEKKASMDATIDPFYSKPNYATEHREVFALTGEQVKSIAMASKMAVLKFKSGLKDSGEYQYLAKQSYTEPEIFSFLVEKHNDVLKSYIGVMQQALSTDVLRVAMDSFQEYTKFSRKWLKNYDISKEDQGYIDLFFKALKTERNPKYDRLSGTYAKASDVDPYADTADVDNEPSSTQVTKATN